MKETSELFKEICTFKGWDSESTIDYEANLTLLRKKFRFLMNRIVFRNNEDYTSEKTYSLPDEDVNIVKELLIMSVKGLGIDENCKRWFNGSLKLNDYKRRADLYTKLENYIGRLFEDNKINEVTYRKWLATFDTSLCGNVSKQILSLYQSIDSFVEASVGLNNTVDLRDVMIEEPGGNITPLFPVSTTSQDITEMKLWEILRYSNCQEDYINNLNSIIQYMKLESIDKTSILIKSIINKTIENKCVVDATFNNENLAFEGFGLFEQLYVFLENNPEALNQISEETKLKRETILSFFKFIKRDKS